MAQGSPNLRSANRIVQLMATIICTFIFIAPIVKKHIACQEPTALMADRLDNLPFAIGLSRQSCRVIKQNLVISLGMVAVLIPLTILGISGIGPAVIGHEGSTLVVVFNGLRLLVYKKR